MIVQRVSPLTLETNSMEIDVTAEQLAEWRRGAFIQDAAPQLTADEREFIKTGYTADDWEKIFPEEDDDAIQP